MDNNNLPRISCKKAVPQIDNPDFKLWLTSYTPEFRTQAIQHSIYNALQEMGITENIVLKKALIQISLCCKVNLKRVSPPTIDVNRSNENSSEKSSNVKRNYHPDEKYYRITKPALRHTLFNEQRLKMKQKFEQYRNHFRNKYYSSINVSNNSGHLKHKKGINFISRDRIMNECLDNTKNNEVTEESFCFNSPECKTTIISLTRKGRSELNEEESLYFEKYKIRVENSSKRKFNSQYGSKIKSSDESDIESYVSRSSRKTKFERKCKRRIESSDESEINNSSKHKFERNCKRKFVNSDEGEIENQDRKFGSRIKRKFVRNCGNKIESSDESENEYQDKRKFGSRIKRKFKRNCKRKIESSDESEIEYQDKRKFGSSDESGNKLKSLQSEQELDASKNSDSLKISKENNSDSNEFIKSCSERFNNIVQANSYCNYDDMDLNISLSTESSKNVSSKQKIHGTSSRSTEKCAESSKEFPSKNSTNITISHKSLSSKKSDLKNSKHETIIVKLYEDEMKNTVQNVRPLILEQCNLKTLPSNIDNAHSITVRKIPYLKKNIEDSEVNIVYESSDLEKDIEDCEVISIPDSPNPRNDVEDSEVKTACESPKLKNNIEECEVIPDHESPDSENNVEDSEVIYVHESHNPTSDVEDNEVKTACKSPELKNNIEGCEVISDYESPNPGSNVEDSEVKTACKSPELKNNIEGCEVISDHESPDSENIVEDSEIIYVHGSPNSESDVEDSEVKTACESSKLKNNIEESEIVHESSNPGSDVEDSEVNAACESPNLKNNIEECEVISIPESPNPESNLEDTEVGKVHESPDLRKKEGESNVGKIWVRDISTLMASPVPVKEKVNLQPNVCESSEDVPSTTKIPRYLLEGFSKPDIHFMKLYKLQFDELVDSKIEIMGGLLHMCITDFMCKEERLKWAGKLLSQNSITTERQRIGKDYWYNMRQRGIEFTALLGSFISRFEEDCVREMFFALYARLIESVLKIDSENARHLYLSRNLISSMLLRNNYKNQIIIGLLQESNEEFQKLYCKFRSLLKICNSYYATEDGKVSKFDPFELEKQQIMEGISVNASKIPEINKAIGNKVISQENGSNSSRTDKESSVSSLEVSFIPNPNTMENLTTVSMNKDTPTPTINHQNCSNNKATDSFKSVEGSTVKKSTIHDHAYTGNHLSINNNPKNKNIPNTQVSDITHSNRSRGSGQIFESLDISEEDADSSSTLNIPQDNISPARQCNVGVVFPMSIDPLSLNTHVDNLNPSKSLSSFVSSATSNEVTNKTGLNQLLIKQTSKNEKTTTKISLPTRFYKTNTQHFYKMLVPNNSEYLQNSNNSTGKQVIVRKVASYQFSGVKANGKVILPKEKIAQGSEIVSQTSPSCLLNAPSNSTSTDDGNSTHTVYVSTNQPFKKTVPSINVSNASNVIVSLPQTTQAVFYRY